MISSSLPLPSTLCSPLEEGWGIFVGTSRGEASTYSGSLRPNCVSIEFKGTAWLTSRHFWLWAASEQHPVIIQNLRRGITAKPTTRLKITRHLSVSDFAFNFEHLKKFFPARNYRISDREKSINSTQRNMSIEPAESFDFTTLEVRSGTCNSFWIISNRNKIESTFKEMRSNDSESRITRRSWDPWWSTIDIPDTVL